MKTFSGLMKFFVYINPEQESSKPRTQAVIHQYTKKIKLVVSSKQSVVYIS